ncbi:expressed unknown protein [Seminavis robusta]|uniref:Uncharacterized protein n=1 Tax=Seminavis robusta TaxID=568900 RepID=A0A9N8HDJ5_9STRA|nr:expressed unknown protein [Seminavis robusta]|eukprot:Sro364_g127050.1 n/a (562) ;mRNA; f:21128-22813
MATTTTKRSRRIEAATARQRSMISVDLGMPQSAAALVSLHQTTRRKCRVKGAYVHTNSCIWYGPPKVDLKGLVGVFVSLAKLPHLERVTVDLDNLVLPVTALTILLRDAPGLTELTLCHLALMGTDEQFQQLAAVMERNATQLTHVTLVHCYDGTARLQRSLVNLPALEQITLKGTRVAPWSDDGAVDDNGEMLVQWCKAPKLKLLELEDNANLRDEHLLYLCEYLSRPDLESNLNEFKLSSSVLDGEVAGNAILDMAMINTNIHKLTLKLSGCWKSCGASVASMICAPSNNHLQNLVLGVYGGLPKTVVARSKKIFKALGSSKCQLKRLRLYLDMDSVLDGPPVINELFGSVEKALQSNDRLKDLVLYDDCNQSMRLPSSVITKLQLNKSGIPRLLRRKNTNTRKFQASFVKAIVEHKEDINTVFYALLENPSVLLAGAPSSLPATSTTDSEDLSLDACSDHTSNMIESPMSSPTRNDENSGPHWRPQAILGHPFRDLLEHRRHLQQKHCRSYQSNDSNCSSNTIVCATGKTPAASCKPDKHHHHRLFPRLPVSLHHSQA